MNEDLKLPQRTIDNVIRATLEGMDLGDIKCHKEARELLNECCLEFVHLVGSEAHEVCERSTKKVINPNHVFKAMEDLGFANTEVLKRSRDALGAHKARDAKRPKLTHTKRKKHEPTAEDIARQKALFAQAKARQLAKAKIASAGGPASSSLPSPAFASPTATPPVSSLSSLSAFDPATVTAAAAAAATVPPAKSSATPAPPAAAPATPAAATLSTAGAVPAADPPPPPPAHD
ncbi:uncharacterized protein AMSG_10553 [Thecamonas trahens ATCC 50062]|uniref:Transcription factor CBF/NF-Y/archaeal histone domain-containing protein n=1 Tax=Thecamonas trahens ATCC 50062 TaxID=461836 RepID=A0A0L0DRL5_THETB|nr:hypothetical protein AMSG_10553 [Thecamonas trahens ATCC 50062]KNC54897.1 hypothetical protein AMSG_10553 [Thecamonas trahens ATCC 50062]|eukprot:XP_013753488.1 hypothetical protein AMSG_10553 [Thecamonas trahens ATCC 50062]